MITLSDITLGYGARTLLEGACATFGRGEFVALMGRNGAGKSTMLRAMAGLAHPAEGEISFNGRAVADMKPREIATLTAFVSTDEVRVANLSVADTVALGRAPYTNWLGRLSDADRALAMRAMELTGVAVYAEKALDTLSDGERQRVMIARALAQQTPAIILDEPTAYLDLPNRYEIFSLLGRLACDEKKAVICSTHDLDIATSACTTIAFIDDGRLVCGPAEAMKSKVEEILCPNACR